MATGDYVVDKLDETIIIKLSEPYEKVERVVGYVDEIIGEDSANKLEGCINDIKNVKMEKIKMLEDNISK
jgi:hypothetical protein